MCSASPFFGHESQPLTARLLQINEALDFAIQHSPVELQKLSPDGKLLVEDVRDILESARMMISEKNQGELFQNFIYATT